MKTVFQKVCYRGIIIDRNVVGLIEYKNRVFPSG